MEDTPHAFGSLLGAMSPARAGFYKRFRHEADLYDTKLLEKYHRVIATAWACVGAFSTRFYHSVVYLFCRLTCSPES